MTVPVDSLHSPHANPPPTFIRGLAVPCESNDPLSNSCLTLRSLFGPDGVPCVVLWRPEALDCRELYPSRDLEWTYP